MIKHLTVRKVEIIIFIITWTHYIWVIGKVIWTARIRSQMRETGPPKEILSDLYSPLIVTSEYQDYISPRIGPEYQVDVNALKLAEKNMNVF